MALAQSRAAGGEEPRHELIDERGQRLPLVREQLVAGRGAECDIRLSDELASRRHFQLQKTPAGWQIEDLHSTNGTLLNGVWLSPGVPVPLALSDRITVGHTTFILQRSVVPGLEQDQRERVKEHPAGAMPPKPRSEETAKESSAGVHQLSAVGHRQSAIPLWQWLCSVAIAAGIVLLAYGAFQPWLRIQFRLALENIPGGDIASGMLSLVDGLLQRFLQKPPLVTQNTVQISGMQLYGGLTLLAAGLAGLVVIFDLALRLKRSVVPGVVCVLAACLPAFVMAVDNQRLAWLSGVPILFRVTLLDILTGAARILDLTVTPLGGLHLTLLGLGLLAASGIFRAALPMLLLGRHSQKGKTGAAR